MRQKQISAAFAHFSTAAPQRCDVIPNPNDRPMRRRTKQVVAVNRQNPAIEVCGKFNAAVCQWSQSSKTLNGLSPFTRTTQPFRTDLSYYVTRERSR